ncbi:MAG TPA: hypothetical protein VFP44_01365 [Usitatibacter sp.]|nr:hypothetical protein [Usitatibacter sp.]
MRTRIPAFVGMTLAAVAACAAMAAPPTLDRARSGPCVDKPEVMRRVHMDLLTHGRDQTVHMGLRDGRASLQGCVNCHASREDHRVVGSDHHFCQGCHEYAGVRLDCFGCHASRAR